MRLAKSLGVIVTAHCENADAVRDSSKELAGRRQDRAAMARAVAAGIGRGDGRASSDHLRGHARHALLHRPHQLRAGRAAGAGRPRPRGRTSGSKR